MGGQMRASTSLDEPSKPPPLLVKLLTFTPLDVVFGHFALLLLLVNQDFPFPYPYSQQ